ncbi:NADH dehydrogenase [Luteibacter sp. Sphag1AF]|uniref:NAD(P)H-binding protein n=1 Tax=Luteibacter sp. Sphag1AF TaxID=2587031 RepID=UPI00160D830B|nr:NADH dehydrogenase [Luteibacter sp. Sphag1AF]
MNPATVLVVGATGQLGSLLVESLASAGTHAVRALVRPHAQAKRLFGDAVAQYVGDLRDAPSLARACAGVDVVIATATVVFPKGKYSFAQDEGQGYRNLIDACKAAGVRRIVFVSLCVPFESRYVDLSATYRMKAHVEGLLASSGVPHTVLRCAPFMDDYFALIGSRVPLLGEKAATLDRSRGMTRWMRRMLGESIDRWSFALVPGSAARRHAFVALSDVAAFAIAAMGRDDGESHTLDVTGPRALSWHDVGSLFAERYQRPIRVFAIPVPVLRLAVWLTRPFSEALANQMSILWILGQCDTEVDKRFSAISYGVALTDARTYLARKFRLLAPQAGVATETST